MDYILKTLLDAHSERLEIWRKRTNLVGPGPIDFHYQDCQQAIGWLQPEGAWADMGTGAGFPGIVFAHLFPHTTVDLIDSRKKRCAFLREVVKNSDHLAHNVHILCSRLEHISPHQYDGVLSRALAPTDKTLEHATRLLKPMGYAVLMLQADQAIEGSSGFKEIHTEYYEIKGKKRRAVQLQWCS